MAYAPPNPSSHTKARIQRTEAYAEKVRRIYAQTVNDILKLKLTKPDIDSGVMYSFDGDSEKVQAQVEQLLRRLHSSVVAAIRQGISLEWGIANKECDALVQSCFGKRLIESGKIDGWMRRNSDAMQSFINRSEQGMNLSDRVWRDSRHLRDELEAALTVGMGEGKSAAQMSRDVRQYLNDPDLMMRRFSYKEKEPIVDDEGNVVGYTKGEWKKKWKKRIADPDKPGRYKWIDVDRDSYIPKGAGSSSRGVYKSAAKNSMRLTRTETNMAYRNADHERWQQLDFVKGQRVILSKQHPVEDICDRLSAPNKTEYDKDDTRGVYPKDFRFEGWHPQCFCFVTPILVSEDEMEAFRDAALDGKDYQFKQDDVYDYPSAFKDFCNNNADKITDRDCKNPYFIDHNQGVVAKILRGEKFTSASTARALTIEDINNSIAALPGAKWHTPSTIKGSASNQMSMWLDNYEAVNGEDNFTRAFRQKLDNGYFTIKEMRDKALQLQGRIGKDEMDAMETLSAIHKIDASKLPQSWLADMQKSLSACKGMTFFEYKGYLGTYGNPKKSEMVHAVLHCDNIGKLAKNKDAIKYGLDKLSSKTPVQIFEHFVSKDKALAAAIPDKAFFDGLKHYVPLEVTDKGGAFCEWHWPPSVKIPYDERHTSIASLKNALYHEYGHAYDRLSNIDEAKSWSVTHAELRKEYDSAKSVITDKWRNDAKKVLDDAYDNITSPLSKKEIERINALYDSKRDAMTLQTPDFDQWVKKRRELDIEEEKALGIYEQKRHLKETSMTISDIVEAMDSAHVSLGYGGHGKDYWSKSANRDLMEFIAECAEARHLDYSLLQKAAPEIYSLMLKYGKVFWP